MSGTTTRIQNCLDRIKSDDPDALDDLFATAWKRLENLAHENLKGFRRLRCEGEETGTILSESWERLQKAVKDLRPDSPAQFEGLVLKKVREVLIDQLRKCMAAKRGAGRRRQRDHDDEGPGPEPEIDNWAEWWLQLFEHVRRLSDKQQAAFDLIFLQELTEREAAEVLKVHKDTVGRWWQEARIELGSLLRRQLPPARFEFTADSLESLRKANLPEAVLVAVKRLCKSRFEREADILEALAKLLPSEDLSRYKKQLLDAAIPH